MRSSKLSVSRLVLAGLVSGCTALMDGAGGEGSTRSEAVRKEVIEVLERQAVAWNEGDLEAFMDDYWRSPDLVFTSGGRVQRGWQMTLDRYRATYGSAPETMGRLSFSEVEVHPLGGGAAWVLGRWGLERQGRVQGGIFTLVFRRIDGRWLIVHDHTSSSE
jgi:ketosteroid isomerase-like protein